MRICWQVDRGKLIFGSPVEPVSGSCVSVEGETWALDLWLHPREWMAPLKTQNHLRFGPLLFSKWRKAFDQ